MILAIMGKMAVHLSWKDFSFENKEHDIQITTTRTQIRHSDENWLSIDGIFLRLHFTTYIPDCFFPVKDNQ